MGYRAGINYYTHYSGGINGKGDTVQCDYCTHSWTQKGWRLPKRCPNCGRKLCSGVPC